MLRLALAILAMTAIPGGFAAAQTVDPNTTIPLAPLAGPNYTPASGQSAIGFYGTDLGFTMKHEGQLRILFGDSWAGPMSPSIGPIGDDCQGVICLQSSGCPAGGRVLIDGDAVQNFTTTIGNFFERPGPPLVFRLNAFGLVAPLPVYAGSTLLDMGPLKTPTAVFSNAKPAPASGAYAFFYRGEAVPCNTGGTCSNGFSCDTTLGVDVNGFGCALGAAGCNVAAGGGICTDTTSSRFSPGVATGRLKGAVTRTRLGNADPLIHEIYYTQPWDTNKFINPSATTVNSYSIDTATGVGAKTVADPNPANGTVTNTEKVFLWGRPSFAGVSGKSAKVYLAVADVPSYSGSGTFTWKPRFFTGLNGSGNPVFTAGTNQSKQNLAQPLKNMDGTDIEPLDIVNQLTVRFIAPLNKWVMIYGGDVDPALYTGAAGGDNPVVRNPRGAVHIRFASQPWGPWTAPVPLLNANPVGTTSPGQYGLNGALHNPICGPSLLCIQNEPLWDALVGHPEPGFLYGANLIPEWTEDRGATVDIYWNVSTWAPYQVVLMRSTIKK